MKNNIMLVSVFLMLLTTGSFFDALDKINRYGWDYEVNVYVDGEMITAYTFSGYNSLLFGSLLLFVTANALYVYWKIKAIRKN